MHPCASKVDAALHPQTFLNVLCQKRKHYFQTRFQSWVAAQCEVRSKTLESAHAKFVRSRPAEFAQACSARPLQGSHVDQGGTLKAAISIAVMAGALAGCAASTPPP